MNFLGKRSIRKFKDIPVEKEALDEIIKAAIKAPSGLGKDPCEFIVFDTREEVKKLSGIKPRGGISLETATAAIAVLVNKDKASTLLEDGAVATHTIGLKAYDLGLGSCWVHMVGRQAVDNQSSEEFFRKIVPIPENLVLFALVAIGYSNEEKPEYTEKDLNFDKVSYNKYDKK